MSSVETVFVVLSDLHFGKDLYEAPEMQLLNIPISFGFRSNLVTSVVEKQCRGHYQPCVAMLPWYLKTLQRELNEQGYRGTAFDLFILLGDQSTLTSEQSYKFLREYLTQASYTTNDGYTEHRCRGLDIAPSSILAIPGNHDKLLRRNLDIYHREFTAELKLRERVEPQRCTISIRRFGMREFVFILLDPSVYCDEELKLDGAFRRHLAQGKVTEKLIEDLQEKLKIVKDGGSVDGHTRLEHAFRDAMKIMLVHYAVDQGPFKSISGLNEWVIPHGCKGLDTLVSELKSKFDLNLVIHGHMHYPLLYNFKGVQVVAASTTTRVDRQRKTGFFLLKTLDSGEVRAEHHLWNGAVYARDPDTSLSRPIGYLPGRTVAA